MKIGFCAGIDRAATVKKMGYDYVEESLSRIASLSDAEFSARCAEYGRLGLPVYAFNAFFGGDVDFYAEDSLDRVRRYADRALERAAAMGGSICVLGSGNQRNIPDGVDRAFAETRFCDILSVCGEAADRRGLKIALEPLSTRECNFIHTVAEAVDIVERVGGEGVGVLVDFFHFFSNQDSAESLARAGGRLIHAHIARPNADRMMPTEEDIPTLETWADMLRRMNYGGAISVEASFGGRFESLIEQRTRYLYPFAEAAGAGFCAKSD